MTKVFVNLHINPPKLPVKQHIVIGNLTTYRHKDTQKSADIVVDYMEALPDIEFMSSKIR